MRRLRNRGVYALLAGLALLGAGIQAPAAETPDKWAEAMERFAEADETSPPPKGGILFVGSSSIRKWDLVKSFPELDPPPVNRGFGGSEISDSVRHFDLLVAKHRPKTVVMYAGDNDIANGKSPEKVAADFKAFAARLHEALPKARLIYLSIKPSSSRWKHAPRMRAANAKIESQCAGSKSLTFVDIWKPMLGQDGLPRDELFVKDRLHLSAAGYRLWAGLVESALE